MELQRYLYNLTKLKSIISRYPNKSRMFCTKFLLDCKRLSRGWSIRTLGSGPALSCSHWFNTSGMDGH